MLYCDFNYCIYNNNFRCILEAAHINAWGMCEECMMVALPEGTLQALKKIQLQQLSDREKKGE